MVSSNFLVFSFILFFATAMAPLAHAQSPGGRLGMIRINGTVFCSLDGNRVTDGVTNPAFANAAVQLQCGSSRTLVSSTVTDSAGVFLILLDRTTYLLSYLVHNCNIIVTTPLASCNESLPAGGALQSSLLTIDVPVFGVRDSINLFSSGFSYVADAQA